MRREGSDGNNDLFPIESLPDLTYLEREMSLPEITSAVAWKIDDG